MLKIKKCHPVSRCVHYGDSSVYKGNNNPQWIVYSPDNFKLHTHCYSLRVALVIRNNVLNRRIPKSTNIQMIISHIRLTRDKEYKRQLLVALDRAKAQKKHKILHYVQNDIKRTE